MTRLAAASDDDVVRAGGVVGQYRLVRQIGEGGMASVWRAEHQRIGRPVAVKFLTLGLGAKTRRDRFLREAKIVASIRHRNVVSILDYGELAGGRAYMVLELLDGESLADRLTREPRMTTEEALNVAMLTLSGLAAAHAAGVVHRDVKPSNIFLVPEDGGVFPKLLDFGISMSADPDTSGPTLTQAGAIVGTPEYMSPEQARGLRDIDVRTDIWSMGVVLYEMLTGVKPFAADNFGDVVIGVTSKDVQPVHEIARDLDRALGSIVARAMTRDRDRRFASAVDMRTAIFDLVAPLRMSAPATTRNSGASLVRQRGEGVKRRRRGPVALGVVLVLTVVAAASYAFFPQQCVAVYSSTRDAISRWFGAQPDATAPELPATDRASHEPPAKRTPGRRAPRRAPR